MPNQQQAVIDDPSTISPASVPRGQVNSPAPIVGPVRNPQVAMTGQPAAPSYQVPDPTMSAQPAAPAPPAQLDAAPTYQPQTSMVTPQGFIPEALQNIGAREAWAPQIQQDLEENRFAAQSAYRNAGLQIRDQGLELREQQDALRQKQAQDALDQKAKATQALQDMKDKGIKTYKAPDGSEQPLTENGKPVFNQIQEKDAPAQYFDDKGNFTDDSGNQFTGPPGAALKVTRDRAGNLIPVDPDRNVKPEDYVDDTGTPWVIKKNQFNAWQYIDPAQAITDPKMQQSAAKALWTAASAKAETARDQTKTLLDSSAEALDPDKLGVNEKVLSMPPQNQLLALQPTLKAAQTVLDGGPPKAKPSAWFGLAGGGVDQDEQDAYNQAKQQVSMLAPHIQNLQNYVSQRDQAAALKNAGPNGFLQNYLQGQKKNDVDTDLAGSSTAQTTATQQPNSVGSSSGLANSPSLSSGAVQSPTADSSSQTPSAAVPESLSQITADVNASTRVPASEIIPRLFANVAGGAGTTMQGIGYVAKQLFPTAGSNLEVAGQALRNQADVVGKGGLKTALGTLSSDPAHDSSVGAQLLSGAGQMAPIIASGPAAPFVGAAQMGQQFKDMAKQNGLSTDRQAGAFAIGAVTGLVTQKLAGMVPILREAQGMEALKTAVTADNPVGLAKALAQTAIKNAARGGAEGVAQSAAGQVASYNPSLPESETNVKPLSGAGIKADLSMAAQNALLTSVLGTGFAGLGVRDANNKITKDYQSWKKDNPTSAITRSDYAQGVLKAEQDRQQAQAVVSVAKQFSKIDQDSTLTPDQRATAKLKATSNIAPEARAAIHAQVDLAADAQRKLTAADDADKAHIPPADPALAKLSDDQLATRATVTPHPDDPEQIGPVAIQQEIARRQAVKDANVALQPALAAIHADYAQKSARVVDLAKTPEGNAILDGLNRQNSALPPGMPKADMDTAQLASDVSPKTEPDSNLQPHTLGYLPLAHDVEAIPDPRDRNFAQSALKVLNGREIDPTSEKALVGSEGKPASTSDLPAHLGASGMPLAYRSDGNIVLTDEGLDKLRSLVPSARDMLSKDGMPVTSQHLAEQQGKVDEKAQPKKPDKPAKKGKNETTILAGTPVKRIPRLSGLEDSVLSARLQSLQAGRERLQNSRETQEKKTGSAPAGLHAVIAAHDRAIAEHEQEIAARQAQRQPPVERQSVDQATSPTDRYWTATGDRGTEVHVPAEAHADRASAANALRAQLKSGELLHDNDVYPPEPNEQKQTASESSASAVSDDKSGGKEAVESGDAAEQKSEPEGSEAPEHVAYDEHGVKLPTTQDVKREAVKLTASLDNLNTGRGLTGSRAIRIVSTKSKNTMLHAVMDHDGAISVQMNPERIQREAETFRQKKEGGSPHRWIQDAMGEELKHVADLLAAREKWEAAGKQGSAEEFWKGERRKDLATVKDVIDGGDRAVARAFVQSFHNYANIGHPISDADFAAKTGDVSDENVVATARKLIDRLQKSEDGLDVTSTSEFIRQMIQAKNDGTLTETGYHAVVGRLLDWMKRVYENLQHAAHNSPEIAHILKPIEDLLKVAESPEHKAFKPMTDEEIAEQEKGQKEAKEAMPQTLMQHAKEIAREIGIKPGDYDAQELKEGLNKGHLLGLLRKEGMSMDQFRQALNQLGFNFETPNDAVQAIMHKPDMVPDTQPGGLKAGHNQKDGFYSHLENVIDAKMPGKAPAGAIRAMLKGNGVKDDEMKWSGVDDYLTANPTASKVDLQRFLREEGGVKIQTTTLGEPKFSKSEKLTVSSAEKHGYFDVTDSAGKVHNGIEFMPSNRMYRLKNSIGGLRAFDTKEEALREVQTAYENGFKREQTSGTKYDAYAQPGGANYRENVFSLPDRTQEAPTKVISGNVRAQRDSNSEFPDGWIVSSDSHPEGIETTGRNEQEAVANARRELANNNYKPAPSKENYISSHFPVVPNYLAHSRASDRVDSKGEPGTLIHELQSDRHQKGREKGYKDSATVEKAREESKKAEQEWMEFRQKLVQKYGPSYGGKASQEELSRLRELNSEQARKSSDSRVIRAKDEAAVPDAPYRKTWHEMLFRKALNEAVQSGKKWIGWDTGETQNDRYDLSHHIDSISYRKNADGTFNLRVLPKGSTEAINEVGGHRLGMVDAKDLPEVVGKEVAQKIVNGEGEQDGLLLRKLSGLDLKVGGEGMKGFYDKIMPSYVAKYAKQWGVKPEVETMKTPYDQAKVNSKAEDLAREAGTLPDDESLDWLTGGDKNKFIEEAEKELGVGNQNKIWRLPITDEMRKSVEENGQPLFAGSNKEEPLKIKLPQRGEATKPMPAQTNRDVYAKPDPSESAIRLPKKVASYVGDQETVKGKIPLYNLTEDIEGHPKGSTVTGDTLKKSGYEVPETGALKAGSNEIYPDDYGKLLSELQQGMPAQWDIDALRDKAMAEKPGEQTIGQPRKANPAAPSQERRTFDAIQHMREDALKQEKQTHEQWNQEAYKMLEANAEKVKSDLLKKALDPAEYGNFTAPEVKAAQILTPQLMEEGYRTGNEGLKREAATLAWGYDQGGSNQARAFSARHDPFKTPRQRNLEYLTKMMTMPSPEESAHINEAPTAKERASRLEKAQNDRLQKIEKALSEMGIKPEDIFAGEARVSLKSAKFVQDAIGRAEDTKTKQAMRMFLDKSPMEVIRQQTGLSKEAVQAARDKFDVQIRAKVADYVRNRGFRAKDFESIDPAALKAGAEPHVAGPKMTPEEENAEIEKVMQMIRGDYKDADAGKYVKRRKMGPKSRTPEQADHDTQQPFDWAKFDAGNKEQTVRAARFMQAAMGNKWEMVHEYWQNSILSGPQTHVAISIGQGANAMHEFIFKRPVEAALNAIIKDPKSAQFGELSHLYRGIMPGISRGWAQAMKTFRTENDFTKADMLNGQMEIQPGDFQGQGHIGIIRGKVGRVIRIPCRVIMALDSFNKNLAGMMAVGAEAYRSGKGMGLEKEELSKHIDNEIKTPGSESWQKAYDVASNQVGFHAEVPKLMKSVMEFRNLRGQTSLVDKMARMATAMLFPFVKVPYNLTRIGLRKSPLGALNVGGHILNGAYSMSQGKPFIEGYSKAQQISDAAEQFLAWGAAALLASAVEGDKDDDKKMLLITAPRYYGVNKPGDVAALDREYGGPSVIRIGGRGGMIINYGKYEPLATVLGTIATGVRGFKDKPGNFMPDVMQGIEGQLKGNSFVQGMSTILDTINAAPKFSSEGSSAFDGLGAKWVEQFVQGFVPNIFRQPIRNWDSAVRDSKFAGPGYVMTQNPAFVNQATDLYGRPETKTGVAPLRVLFQSGVTPSPQLELGDKFLTNYNRTADKAYWPDRPTAAQYSLEVNGKKVQMTANQASAYDKIAGQMFKQKLSGWLTPAIADKPTEEYKKRFTEDLDDARKQAKERIQTTSQIR